MSGLDLAVSEGANRRGRLMVERSSCILKTLSSRFLFTEAAVFNCTPLDFPVRPVKHELLEAYFKS